MADALQGIGAVVSTQLLARAVTFILNILIARLAAPSEYGVSYISLQLFSNLSLFITKEGFRKVALRDPKDEKHAPSQSSLNLGWGGICSSALLSLPLAFYWMLRGPAAAPQSYYWAVALMAVASVVESLGEPFLICTLAAMDFRARAFGEGVAILARTIVMFLLAASFGDLPLAFAISQLLYSIVWVMWFMRHPNVLAWMPSRLPSGQWLHPDHYELLVEFGGKVLMKLALTEGEKLLLLILFTQEDWGVFGLVSNLGSIVLRLLFAPTEEIAYSSFAGGGAQWHLLRALLMLQGGVGWLGLCFGPGFSKLVVRILYGVDWANSAAPQVLTAYCVLLFFMALNGILEAYVDSQSSPRWVRLCNLWQILISLVLVIVAWGGSGYGPVALVWANCAAMLLRVLLCVYFVRQRVDLSSADLRAASALKLAGLLLVSGCGCSMIVPPVSDTVPWARAAIAIALAGSSILASGFLCRQELRMTFAEVRSKKTVDMEQVVQKEDEVPSKKTS
ncbi:unnamed protein product [Prorocentrum cordatum]|uniref:Protein RFT1 homolog n=1 Tax=Prorocentrum cordatum TaxID=2364126 RepID=A0ABN9RJE3_9DINO|nr:unnamed protein product [Polarella glacialis]